VLVDEPVVEGADHQQVVQGRTTPVSPPDDVVRLGERPRAASREAAPAVAVPDLAVAMARVEEFGGSVIHPGERWVICRDSEGSPFGLTIDPASQG